MDAEKEKYRQEDIDMNWLVGRLVLTGIMSKEKKSKFCFQTTSTPALIVMPIGSSDPFRFSEMALGDSGDVATSGLRPTNS